MPARTPVERVSEEGASPFILGWVTRIDRHLPAAGPTVAFWASVYARFARHRGSVLAGGLAFFGLLSLVPAILSLGAIVALLFDPASFAAQLEALLADRPEAAAVLDPIVAQLGTLSDTTLTTIGLTGLVSIALSLYAASRFLYVGRQVLDVAFELDPQPPNMLSRAIAIAITLVAQLAIAFGLVALTVVPRILDALGIGTVYSVTAEYLQLPVLAVIVYLILTASMRFGTNARRVVGWLNVGAPIGTLIILGGTLGLGWYLSVSSTYSQIVAILGGVVALEIWLYVLGLGIVVSAEIEGLRNGFRRRDRPVA